MYLIRRGQYFNCLTCNKRFYRSQKYIKAGKTKYCSIKCYGKSKIGKENFNNKHKGNRVNYNCDECQKLTSQKLAVYKKAIKHFCSKKCSNVYKGKLKSGENHPNWKGGITPYIHSLRHSPEYNEWRKAVYRRDYWTCQDCKVKQKHPIAHHLKSFREYPDLRFTVDNGVTLCRSCHKKRHEEIGFNTRFTSS